MTRDRRISLEIQHDRPFAAAVGGAVIDEATVLNFDPWAGDYDSDARTMRDLFVTTRKPAKCAICFDTIKAGARIRAQTQISEEQRKAMTFKFCQTCCRAMEREGRDHGRSIEARYAKGIAAAGAHS